MGSTPRERELERLRAAVPPNVRAVCRVIAEHGKEAVTVGGAVRDAILGRDPGDWDVATSALPEEVLAWFPRCIPTGLQHGTVTIVTGRGEESHVEVTTYRGEGEYSDGRRPDAVHFGVPLEHDLARRDLRVNAMAYDPATDRLIDPYGGMADLEEKVLRAVGPTGDVFVDAVARFTEDGLRVMRAVRFAAQLEFALDPETARGIAEPGPLGSLAKVSRERVSDELRKILGAREPSRALVPARATGIVRTVMPALDAAIGAGEEAAQAWARAVDGAAADARLAVMFAPLGAMEGKALDKLLRDLKFGVDELRAVVAVVGSLAAARRASTAHEARVALGAVGRPLAPLAVDAWRALHLPIADVGGGVLARNEPIVVGDLAIGGKDLMDAGIPAGPQVGTLLRALLVDVLADPSLNDRDTLLSRAKSRA